MTFDYTSAAADALAVLNEFGASATLTSTTAGTYDPAAGTSTPADATSTVQAVVFPYKDRHIDGTLVQLGDQQAFLAAGGTAPRPGDSLTWQSTVYRIERVKVLAPAGTTVLYEAQLRR
jgi:hypothetical protein